MEMKKPFETLTMNSTPSSLSTTREASMQRENKIDKSKHMKTLTPFKREFEFHSLWKERGIFREQERLERR
jgi:hypothetical protein